MSTACNGRKPSGDQRHVVSATPRYLFCLPSHVSPEAESSKRGQESGIDCQKQSLESKATGFPIVQTYLEEMDTGFHQHNSSLRKTVSYKPGEKASRITPRARQATVGAIPTISSRRFTHAGSASRQEVWRPPPLHVRHRDFAWLVCHHDPGSSVSAIAGRVLRSFQAQCLRLRRKKGSKLVALKNKNRRFNHRPSSMTKAPEGEGYG